jgi:uncharacterized protein with ATP-grasp and redox domains
MKTDLECVPCFLYQAVRAVRYGGADAARQEALMRDVLQRLGHVDLSVSPPCTAHEIYRLVKGATGGDDPYREVKRRFNRFVLGRLDALRRRVLGAKDPFDAAVRVSIAGNLIDFGLNTGVKESDLDGAIETALGSPLTVDHVARLKEAVASAARILYLGDNAGEIVLDRLLVEQLPRERVTFVVRGAPILNDALREDAETAGLPGLVEVIDNGSDAPGTILERCSPEFQARFAAADLVIAKGQGNIETLDLITDKRMFFLLKVKCAVLARSLGVPLGSLVVKENR